MILSGGIALLFLLRFCHAPGIAVKIVTALNIGFVIECVLYYLEPHYMVFKNGPVHLVVDAVAMCGLMPVHQYLERRCVDYLLVHSVIVDMKTIVLALLRSIGCKY